jgi:hypothetical protein
MHAYFAKYGAFPAIQITVLERNPERAMGGHDAARHYVSNTSLLWHMMMVSLLHSRSLRMNGILQEQHQ